MELSVKGRLLRSRGAITAVNSPTGTQAVDRAAQLLIEVARHRDPVSFAELTAASGLAKSTTSRLLTALERNGLVRRDVTGRFSPGEVFVSYAWRGGAEADLVSVAQPVLTQLGEDTGETVNLGVPRDGGLVEQIAQVDSTYLIGGTNWVGLAVPLHCAALGKVLLAFGAAELPKGRLEQRTERTITSRPVLAAELAAVRERGYAVTVEELEPGLVAVAAPVFTGSSSGGPERRRHCRRSAVGVGPGNAADGRHPPGRRRPVHRRRPLAVSPARIRAAASHARPARLPEKPAPPGRRCLVTTDELLRQLYDYTLVGNAPEVLSLTRQGLEQGLGPETLLYEALIPSLEEVGARFERGDFFVPEMLIAGKAMAGALEILRPLLAETGAQTIGKIVMGTVKGDVHDIGKNLVNIMFEGAGFEVIDLGVQVAPEKFLDAIREHQPDIVGFSAFLTTTMPMFKANINALQKAGMRDQVIVMVGGAPVTQEYADVVGADGYAADASAAVVRAKELLQRRRAAVNA